MPSRQLLKVADGFDLFHTVLYYLYTDMICFTEVGGSSDLPVPAIEDAEGIYAIADRLLLNSLTEKALHFLESTCTLANITSRAFGSFANLYPPVEHVYRQYFMNHWKEIVRMQEFVAFFKGLEDDPAEYIRVNAKLHEVLRKLP